MKAGDVVIVQFQGARGSKRRPALIISSDTYINERPDVILAVITTNTEAATAKSDHLLQDWELAGLNKASAVRAFLGTYRQSEVSAAIGKLSGRDWTQVQMALRRALAI